MATRFQQGAILSQSSPAGVVQAFAGSAAPDGWLLCNGAAVSRTTYAALFAAIASAHGSGDGSTTFNLPDYRGRVIRGRDGGIARDPDRASRTAANAGGNTGDNVGSVQGQATAKNGLNATGGTASLTGTTTFAANGHVHGQVVAYSSGYQPNNGSAYTNGGSVALSPPDTGGNSSAASVGISSTAAGLTAGDNETRPINAYVNYIIKF